MSDLTDLQSAQTIKIAGANTSGVESSYVSAQTNGTQIALDVGVNVSGVQIDPRQMVDGSATIAGPLMANGAVNHIPVYLPLDTTSSTQNITVQDTSSVTTTGYASQSTIIGTPTAGSAASFTLNSINTVMVIVKGLWTGTLAIEVSADGGITWVPRGLHVVGTGTYSAAITANVIGDVNTTAKTNIRLRATAAMTGTANVSMLLSDNVSNVYVANPIKIIDGSSTLSTNALTIKSASTAALATDMSAVVALSPNSPIPTGTNNIGSITNVTGTISLPTGASTSANQTNGTQKSQIVDASGNVAPSADTAARSSFTRITDATNTATVKAANTSATASDTALVVAISPGSPIVISTKNDLSPSSPTSATVGITSAQAIAANANRKGLVVINTSINTISLGIGATAVLNSGITLYPGGVWVMDEYTYDTGVINAIASAISSNLSIQEFA